MNLFRTAVRLRGNDGVGTGMMRAGAGMKAVGVTVVGVGMRGQKAGMVGWGGSDGVLGGSYGLADTPYRQKRHPREGGVPWVGL